MAAQMSGWIPRLPFIEKVDFKSSSQRLRNLSEKLSSLFAPGDGLMKPTEAHLHLLRTLDEEFVALILDAHQRVIYVHGPVERELGLSEGSLLGHAASE